MGRTWTIGWSVVLGVMLGSGVSHAQQNRVLDVRISGNKNITTQTILTKVTIAKGALFSAEQVERDRRSILDLGWFADVQVEGVPTASGYIVEFQVEENEVVQEVVVQGEGGKPLRAVLDPKTKQPAEQVIRSALTVLPGRVLNFNQLREDADKIEQLYRDSGYIGRLSEPQFSGGKLTLTILEASIEKITIRYDSKKPKTKERTIRRELVTQEGDLFNARRLSDDMNTLFNLPGNVFETVEYKTLEGNELGKIIVEINVKERRTGGAGVGVGFSTRSELVGFVDVNESNLGGMNRQGSIRAEFGDRRTFEFFYAEPWVDKKHTRLEFIGGDRLIFREPRSVFAVTQAVGTGLFEERRKGGRITLSRPLRNRKTSVFASVRNEEGSLLQLDPNTFERSLVSTPERVVSFGFGFVRDTRVGDLRFDARSGARVQVGVEVAGAVLGGQANFRKLDVDLRRYVPVGSNLVVAGRLLLGRAFGSGLPPFEQYFLGGSETLRGYNIDHEFGDNQILVNLELRRRIKKELQIVGFVDWGDAFGGRFIPPGVSRNFSPLLGFGFGLRFLTPYLGPIRLDIGFGREGARTHFSIGPTF